MLDGSLFAAGGDGIIAACCGWIDEEGAGGARAGSVRLVCVCVYKMNDFSSDKCFVATTESPVSRVSGHAASGSEETMFSCFVHTQAE